MMITKSISKRLGSEVPFDEHNKKKNGGMVRKFIPHVSPMVKNGGKDQAFGDGLLCKPVASTAAMGDGWTAGSEFQGARERRR